MLTEIKNKFFTFSLWCSLFSSLALKAISHWTTGKANIWNQFELFYFQESFLFEHDFLCWWCFLNFLKYFQSNFHHSLFSSLTLSYDFTDSHQTDLIWSDHWVETEIHRHLLPQRQDDHGDGQDDRGLQHPGAGGWCWWSWSPGGGGRRVGVGVAAGGGQRGVGLVGATELTIVVHPAVLVGGAGQLLHQVEVLLGAAVLSVTAGLVGTWQWTS